MSSVCFWAVHVTNPEFDIPDTVHNIPNTTSLPEKSFTEALRQNLEENSFSDIPESSLPLSVSVLYAAATTPKSPLLIESMSWAIMGRNIPLIKNLKPELYPIIESGELIPGFYPLHLAATYLDGAKSCCSVFEELSPSFNPRFYNINEMDLTVLDSLMLTIVRSHTTCKPGDLDASLKNDRRFRGEELDICGRWDADTKAFKTLVDRGIHEVPSSWKHMFCHTSAQAICHSICFLFSSPSVEPPDINHPSGLCRTVCTACGMRIRLLPLHVILVVALKLSIVGRADEDLFGILAVVLCLISNGANPTLATHVSHTLYNDVDDEMGCHHSEFTATELCQEIIDVISADISPALRTGWELLHCVLRLSAKEWDEGEPDEGIKVPEIPWESGDLTDEAIEDITQQIPCKYRHGPGDIQGSWLDAMELCYGPDLLDEGRVLLAQPQNFFGSNKDLSTLWASVQTELLTYRRLHENATWVSPAFNMADLLNSLQSGGGIQVDIVTESRMKSFCICGRFIEATNPTMPCMNEVSGHYFSNLDGRRATYISTAYYDRAYLDY
jgi:hypothetical protein